ncbi:hypothetical protein VP424E501_P0078 [Vibrio phage 424E50-1]|nr:hypothetical protein VP424E501_P0078 [Vibrio phage 424E50-1]
MTNPDDLLKTLVSTSCQLDANFGIDWGLGDKSSYVLFTKEDFDYALFIDDEHEVQWESDAFKVVTSPNWEYTLVWNKSYLYE